MGLKNYYETKEISVYRYGMSIVLNLRQNRRNAIDWCARRIKVLFERLFYRCGLAWGAAVV